MVNHTTSASESIDTFPDLAEADHKLIELYFRPGISMINIAQQLGIPLLELARLLAAPHIRSAIAIITAAATQRARDIAAANAPSAMTTMVTIARDSRDTKPETARKAAAAILRAAAPPKPQRPQRSAETPPQPSLTVAAQSNHQAMPRAA
jgi:hypothetical protein